MNSFAKFTYKNKGCCSPNGATLEDQKHFVELVGFLHIDTMVKYLVNVSPQGQLLFHPCVGTVFCYSFSLYPDFTNAITAVSPFVKLQGSKLRGSIPFIYYRIHKIYIDKTKRYQCTIHVLTISSRSISFFLYTNKFTETFLCPGRRHIL